MYNLTICNGKIVDGTGSPWFYGDIAIENDQIAAMGQLKSQPTREMINAEGKVVAPGFIDVHAHSDDKFIKDNQGESKLRQGVTTEVIGQCGSSIAPLEGEKSAHLRSELENENIAPNWQSYGEYLELLQERGIPVNVAGLVGHGTLRKQVMGYENRPPTNHELAQMKEILKGALRDGAVGMSTGLIYPPGSYAKQEELIQLLQVVNECNGIYMTHMRNEGSRLMDSVAETIECARYSGVKTQISHHKTVGRNNWGKVKATLDMVHKAREDGIDIALDQYPYPATSTGLVSLLPQEALEGGRENCLARLQNEDERKRLKAELERNFTPPAQTETETETETETKTKESARANENEAQTDVVQNRGQAANRRWSDVYIAKVKETSNKWQEGKNIEEIARTRDVDPAEAVIQMLVEEDLQVAMIAFSMHEEDIKTVLKDPLVMVGSDGSSISHQGPLAEGKPHPRSFGTFPRIFRKYVREESVLSLEEAVWKMSGLPASRLGIFKRGLLRPSFYADLVIFDPDNISDQATYAEPHHYPEGIEQVFLNGSQVLTAKGHNGLLAGRVIM